MLVRTAFMLFILLAAAIIATYGVWFAFKAHEHWHRPDADSEPHWIITGTLGSVACLVALVKLAYELARI